MLLVVVPLFVAHAEELQVEGLRVAHVGTNLAPRRRDVTIGKLYEVESILDVAVKLVERYVDTGLRGVRILELAAEAARDDRQWLASEVLAEQEELEESEAVGLVVIGEVTAGEGVVPAVLIQGSVLHGANAILPVVARLKVSAFDDAAAGEAEYAGMHVVECLCQVLAHAVFTALPRLDREERDVLYVGRHLTVAPYAEVSLGKGTLGFDDSRVFLPRLATDVNTRVAYLLVVAHRGVVDKVYPQFGGTTVRHTCPYREAVLLATLDTDAEEAAVLNHRVLVAVA